MAITVCIRMEHTDDGVSWWADSPQVPGFTAVASGMSEVITRATLAIADLIEEGDLPDEPVDVQLVEGSATSDNPMRVQRSDAEEITPSPANKARVLVA